MSRKSIKRHRKKRKGKNYKGTSYYTRKRRAAIIEKKLYGEERRLWKQFSIGR